MFCPAALQSEEHMMSCLKTKAVGLVFRNGAGKNEERAARRERRSLILKKKKGIKMIRGDEAIRK